MTTHRIITGDVLDRLREMADGSVHCCVTSPPYWGLRDYGTATWEGGDAGCDHKQETRHQVQGATSARAGRANVEAQRNENFRDTCGKCGATRIDQQLGLEPTPEAYVARMVEVFREVRRVLRDDGTLWLNIGDSYYAGGWECQRVNNVGGNGSMAPEDRKSSKAKDIDGLKTKDLVGVPWLLAFALRADGWYLRSDIIWAKPNPMPESVTDRPTKAHEYMFLMSKSARYYFDASAIEEDSESAGRPLGFTTVQADAIGRAPSGNQLPENYLKPRGPTRNRRTVWTIPTQPYPEAHFATYPEALVEPCIKAGCPEGGVVLDPFLGSGTTLAVAAKLGRSGIGIELNPAYVILAEKRIGLAKNPHTWRDDNHAAGATLFGAEP